MKWEEFLQSVKGLAVIDTENLLAGIVDQRAVKVQISRWIKAGKLVQLKRGMYILKEPYRRIEPFMPYIASLLKSPSYVSLEKALEFHGLIPEAVRVYTCVTTKRPGYFESKAGRFSYQTIKKPLFWGYFSVTQNGQTGFMAEPEKALLDFFHLKRLEITPEYVYELRLQNTEIIRKTKLLAYARRFNKPKIIKTAQLVLNLINEERKAQKRL
jgi:predicted transcriptional regulator of viral defense system